MELWIRSQDKFSLIKANKDIKVIDTKGLKEKLEDSVFNFLSDMEQVKSCLQNGWSVYVDDTILGSYSTKERALEVLDEIQCHLVNINDSRDNYFYVYEMPKE